MDGGRAPDEQLLAQLPVGLAVAIRLDISGYSPRVIATALGIPEEGVGASLQLARSKLIRLQCDDRAPLDVEMQRIVHKRPSYESIGTCNAQHHV